MFFSWFLLVFIVLFVAWFLGWMAFPIAGDLTPFSCSSRSSPYRTFSRGRPLSGLLYLEVKGVHEGGVPRQDYRYVRTAHQDDVSEWIHAEYQN